MTAVGRDLSADHLPEPGDSDASGFHTTALRQLVVDRAGLGYLVYPTSPNVAPPSRQSRGLVWLLRSTEGDSARLRMFGTIVGRQGQFKFLSMTNGV